MKTTTRRNPISFSIIFLGLLTIYSVYFLLNISKYLKQGVDLVGGTYITLDVNINKVYEEILHQTIQDISTIAQENNISIIDSSVSNNQGYCFIENKEQQEIFYALIKDNYKDFIFKKNNSKITIEIDQAIKKKIADNAIDSNIQSLRKRLDPFGAGELLIARQGDSIVIELPNVQDPAHAKRLIGTTAQLSFRPVIDSSREKETLEKNYHHSLGKDIVILPSTDDKNFYVVPKYCEIMGSLLKKAHLGYNPSEGNKPVVQFEFNSVGGKKFRDLTRNNIGKQIAIILDDQIISAPMVNQEIGSTGIIQGNFTAQSAQELSTLLQSGSFAAPVVYAQERVIEPLLGLKTIKQGLFACFIGLVLLFIVSIIMYKVAGLFAFIVLLYNLVCALFGMYLIGGTLTLSGIAGLILTIGMAVDASILIFERIKEELHAGKSFPVALENGFSGAMTVIIDANVTHFLVALVLYYVGAGPLKGFAITMIVGIIATILTGIVLLKFLFKYSINKLGFSSIKI
jgi:preprotein translocase subunit SecD